MEFLITKGQRLEDLVNATETEKIMYFKSMKRYYDDENEKLKAIFGEGKK